MKELTQHELNTLVAETVEASANMLVIEDRAIKMKMQLPQDRHFTVMFVGCNFYRHNQDVGDYNEVKFVKCDFTSVTFEDTSFERASFTNCTFKRAKFLRNSMMRVSFHGCAVDGVDLSWSDLRFMSIERCTLDRVSFSRTKLYGARFYKNLFGQMSWYKSGGAVVIADSWHKAIITPDAVAIGCTRMSIEDWTGWMKGDYLFSRIDVSDYSEEELEQLELLLALAERIQETAFHKDQN